MPACLAGGIMSKLLYWILLCVIGQLPAETCVDCHTSVQTNCNLTCVDCHSASNGGERPTDQHPVVVKNPSLPQYWQEKCAGCHKDLIDHFQKSQHYSNSNMIAQTRFLFGATEHLENEGDVNAWQDLRQVGRVREVTMPALADNLLAKNCLRCHFAADNRIGATGNIRAAGCAACHTSFDQQTGQVQFGHRFQKKPRDAACLTCHSGNHVGGDSYGYFEHDYHNEYNTPQFSYPIFGAYQHHLATDVHVQAGMRCIDCHQETHKSGNTKSCQSCHGGFTGKPEKGTTVKFTGKPVAHKDFHQKVSCGACHAQWSYQDYGLHLFLDESNHYQPWLDYLYQGDGFTTDWLKQQGALDEQDRTPAASPNRLTGSMSSGLWYKGWTFRRWENPVLGKDSKDQYALIRPLYQFYITYVDSVDNLWFDSAIPQRTDGKKGWNWDVYRPHTIGKKGRQCESCHQNPKAARLGIRHSFADSVAHPITVPASPIVPATRLLNSREQNKLLNKSALYKKWRAEQWRRQGIEDWLK